ncbi:MAG: 3-deoxy-8-phosphooctulonate synthase [Candidatus Firestonebacteria bacterium]
MRSGKELASYIFGRKGFFLMAGPCVIESEKQCLDTAKKLKKIADRLKIPYIFKASYDKANRTAVGNYRGPGLKEGLKILAAVKEQAGVPIVTDFHCKHDINAVAEVADIIQIPAYLCQQTDLAVRAGETGKIINVKKGQFLAPWDMKKIAEKIKSTGNNKIILTERGTVLGYNNLVVDMRSFLLMKELGYPVTFDVTHAVRIPGFTSSDSRGGQPGFVEPLALAGVAAGADGLFIETHPNPRKALCDASSVFPLKNMEKLLKKVKKVAEAIK